MPGTPDQRLLEVLQSRRMISSDERTSMTLSRTMVGFPALVVLLATLICFGNSLGGEFVADDYLVVVGNTAIQSFASIPRLFTQSFLFNYPEHGLYRPLSYVSFAINYLFGELNPFGYHLFNLLIHALNGLLVYLLAQEYTGRGTLALSASLLFVAHPVHTEAVSNIAGRPEMLAAAGVLLAWLFHTQERLPHRHWFSSAAYFLGLLAKESAIVLPGVLILADYCARRPSSSKYSAKDLYKYAGYFLVTALYLAIRVAVLNRIGDSVAATVFKDASLQTRILTMSLAFVRYFKLLIWPRELMALYDFSVIPLTPRITLPVAFSMIIIAGIVSVGVWCLWRRRFAAFAILFFFVTISPVSNLVFPTGILIAERALYLPVLGICLLAAGVFAKLFERNLAWRAIALSCLILILSAAAVRDYSRNADWFNQVAYLRGLLRTLPDSPLTPRTLEELGARLAVKGEYNEALGHLKRALELRPNSVDAAYNAALMLERLDRRDEALKYLEDAARMSPGDVEIRNYYASALLRGNQLDRARVELEAVIAMKPDIAEAHNSLGIVYTKQQLYEKARAEFEAALKIRPDDANAINNLQLLK